MKQPLYITKIIKKVGYLLILEFSNKEIRFIDFKDYLKKHLNNHNKILLENPKEFNKVKLDETTLYWPSTKRVIDGIVDYYNPDPEIIYKESLPFTPENFDRFYKLLRKYNEKIKKNFPEKVKDLLTAAKIISML